MKRTIFAMVLGAVLGAFDGMTALISAPETQSQIMEIVLGSTVKGVLIGLVVGIVALRTHSMAIGVAVGLVVGVILAYLVTLTVPYFWEVMLPGTIVGAIVGYATMKYRTPART